MLITNILVFQLKFEQTLLSMKILSAFSLLRRRPRDSSYLPERLSGRSKGSISELTAVAVLLSEAGSGGDGTAVGLVGLLLLVRSLLNSSCAG